MGFGTTDCIDSTRSICAPPITAWGAPSTSQSNSIPDHDSAFAVIRHLHCADIYGIDYGDIDGSDPTFRERLQSFAEMFSKSLAAYVGLVVEVSNGRFSTKALREAFDSVDGAPGMYFWANIPAERDVASLLSRSGRSGLLETVGILHRWERAWLRNNIRLVLLTVLLSMQNIEAERVLSLLRTIVNMNSTESRDR